MRAEGRSLVLLDAGDFIAREGRPPEKSSIQLMIATEFMLDAMDWLGYAAANVGEGDLIFGDAFLEEMGDRISFPLLSASVATGEELVFEPSRVVERAGLRVGIVGTLWEGFGAYVADHADPGRPLELAPSRDAARYGLEVLEGAADLRVLLAHAPIAEARTLALDVPGYDIIISGHDTNIAVIEEPEPVAGARLVQVGWDGKRVGRLDLTFSREGELTGVSGSSTALDASWPDHPVMAALHEEYLARVAEAIEEILEEYPVTAPPAGGSYVGSGECRACHETEWGRWRTTQHATAWQTLSDRHRDYDPECFACHSTGFQFTGGFRIIEQTPHMAGVQCESCHGAGAGHCEAPLLPYTRPGEDACRGCHVPLHSPDFDYETYLPQVEHASAR